jgi:hypothetical protein
VFEVYHQSKRVADDLEQYPQWRSLLHELGECEVAIAYVGVAWKVFVSLLVLGFPVALVFSWAFEITPEGIKRESEVAPNESITHHTGRKIIALSSEVPRLQRNP